MRHSFHRSCCALWCGHRSYKGYHTSRAQPRITRITRQRYQYIVFNQTQSSLTCMHGRAVGCYGRPCHISGPGFPRTLRPRSPNRTPFELSRRSPPAKCTGRGAYHGRAFPSADRNRKSAQVGIFPPTHTHSTHACTRTSTGTFGEMWPYSKLSLMLTLKNCSVLSVKSTILRWGGMHTAPLSGSLKVGGELLNSRYSALRTRHYALGTTHSALRTYLG